MFESVLRECKTAIWVKLRGPSRAGKNKASCVELKQTLMGRGRRAGRDGRVPTRTISGTDPRI